MSIENDILKCVGECSLELKCVTVDPDGMVFGWSTVEPVYEEDEWGSTKDVDTGYIYLSRVDIDTDDTSDYYYEVSYD